MDHNLGLVGKYFVYTMYVWPLVFRGQSDFSDISDFQQSCISKTAGPSLESRYFCIQRTFDC